MNILAIESTFDETAVAVVQDGTTILSHALSSSSLMHKKYGGVLPELAAREQLSSIIPVLNEAMNVFTQSDDRHAASAVHLVNKTDATIRQSLITNIDAIAVSVGPGLIGSLLVGVESAKTIAAVTGIPIIPVNHVLAHMYANFVRGDAMNAQRMPIHHTLITHDVSSITFPAISLVASGGHTELFLMTSTQDIQWLGGTLDDAAGEAFDKTARLLGFENKGGIAIQEAADQFSGESIAERIKLPRPLIHDRTLNFSFSGLKTAIAREVNTLKTRAQYDTTTIQQLAFEVQEAITDVLVKKTMYATEKHHASSILISGGVAANLRLRNKLHSEVQQYNTAASHKKNKQQLTLSVPPISLCTDNAVIIGSYAYFRGKHSPWQDVYAQPDMSVEL